MAFKRVRFMPLAGGTMTGPLILSADPAPSAPLGAATKEYADSTIPYDALVASLNPSAWWKLADAVGSTSVVDSSGNGYTGTVNGTVTFGQTGPITGTPSDTAALFNGTTGYVTTTFNPVFTTFSVTAWYKTTNNSIVQSILDDGTAASSVGFALEVRSGILAGRVGVNYNPLAGADTADGNWHLATMTYDGSTVRNYTDGVLIYSYAFSGSVQGSAGYYIGSAFFVGSYEFDGSLSQIAIMTEVLTAAQILALYNAAPKFGAVAIANGKPHGPQTAPTIPATTVALTNPFPFDCTVYLAGGTVTAVAIGGTATGLTSGMFSVPAGETITLTYSVAPTWTWLGN